MTPEALIIESMFQVVTKDGDDVPFILNSAQRKLDDNLTGRDIIPKARQEGVSTYFLGRYTAAALSKRNVKAVVISHEGEATQRLFSRCKYFIENLRGPKSEAGRTSLNVITFPKTDSMIYIGTAGSKKFGRGDTITHLHCSEYAYWPSPKELLSGALQAVPYSGEVAIESTGNGKGNDYHRRCKRAWNRQSRWRCHFLSWTDFDEYRIELSDEEASQVLNNLREDWEEPRLVHLLGLTPEQIVWRRMILDDIDYDLGTFKQEYPITLDECFQASGSSLFPVVNFIPTDKWKEQGNHLWKLEGHPKDKLHYVIGADPSGGVGRDNACAQVICIETMEQVAEYAHNKVDPYAFGEHISDLGIIFNNAYLVIESNNHGPVTVKAVQDNDYPSFLMYDMNTAGVDYEDPELMQTGFRTTRRTKPIMIGRLKTALAKEIIIHSTELSDELSTFIEHENGSLGADKGCMDDRVMAIACANIGIEPAAMQSLPDTHAPSEDYVDPFSLEGILKELQSRGRDFPIPPQHGSYLNGN